jgi:hypothetical protein
MWIYTPIGTLFRAELITQYLEEKYAGIPRRGEESPALPLQAMDPGSRPGVTRVSRGRYEIATSAQADSQ